MPFIFIQAENSALSLANESQREAYERCLDEVSSDNLTQDAVDVVYLLFHTVPWFSYSQGFIKKKKSQKDFVLETDLF